MSEQNLDNLRAIIDSADEQIIELIARRFAATSLVGNLKAFAGLPPIDEVREICQQERFCALAKEYGLNPQLVLRVFRAIIDEVVTNHRAIAQRSSQ